MIKPGLMSLGELEQAGAIIGIQDGNHGEIHPKATDYVDAGIPFVMASDIIDGAIDYTGASMISENQAQKLRKGFSKEGDVLLTHKGTIGSVAVVGPVEPYIMLTPQVTYYRCNPELLNNRYLAFAFREIGFQKRMKSLSGQSTRPYIGITSQRGLSILHVPLAHQGRIVDVLAPYDDLIENNLRQIALLEDAARQLYKEWFVRFRFPGHEHVELIEEVPEGWERAPASSVMNILSGGTPKTTAPQFWGGDIGFFTPKDAVRGAYVSGTEKTITEEGLAKCSSKLFPQDTLFITARGTVGKMNLALVPMAMNQSCYALASKSCLSQRMLYLTMDASLQQFRSQASGAVFDAIVVATFDRISVIRPDLKTAKAFDELINPVFDQIANLGRQNEQLAKARDLLLPKLMNGTLTV